MDCVSNQPTTDCTKSQTRPRARMESLLKSPMKLVLLTGTCAYLYYITAGVLHGHSCSGTCIHGVALLIIIALGFVTVPLLSLMNYFKDCYRCILRFYFSFTISFFVLRQAVYETCRYCGSMDCVALHCSCVLCE